MKPTLLWFALGIAVTGASSFGVSELLRSNRLTDAAKGQNADASLVTTIHIPASVHTEDEPVWTINSFATTPRVLQFVSAHNVGPGLTGLTQQCLSLDSLDSKSDRVVRHIAGNWKLVARPKGEKKWSDVKGIGDLETSVVPFVPPTDSK